MTGMTDVFIPFQNVIEIYYNILYITKYNNFHLIMNIFNVF